jgi:hypothetical protein
VQAGQCEQVDGILERFDAAWEVGVPRMED